MRSFRPGFIVVGIKMRAFKRERMEGGERERERDTSRLFGFPRFGEDWRENRGGGGRIEIYICLFIHGEFPTYRCASKRLLSSGR